MSPEELQELRAGLDAFAALVAAEVPVAQVQDVQLAAELGGRVYRPDGADDNVLVWFHGGGYVCGTLDAIDPICRWLARALGSTVVSVDYRLAPEHPFPAAVEDAVAALTAVAAWPGVGRIAVGGDSAGGGLAAATAALTNVPLAALLLLCPWLDLTVRATDVTSELTLDALQSFSELYVGADSDVTDPRASPLLAAPVDIPTVIVAAEQDSLAYQAVEYAERSPQVKLRFWPFDHGFVGSTADLPAAGEALDWAAVRLRAVFDH